MTKNPTSTRYYYVQYFDRGRPVLHLYKDCPRADVTRYKIRSVPKAEGRAGLEQVYKVCQRCKEQEAKEA